MGRKAHELSICHVQFIIDNPRLPSSKISAKFRGEISSTVIRKTRQQLGIASQYHGNRRSPQSIAEWCDYNVLETADKLVQYGYGDMKTSELLQLCGS